MLHISPKCSSGACCRWFFQKQTCFWVFRSYCLYLILEDFLPQSFLSLRACSVVQLCLTFCDPMYCRPPGSPVHGTSQARILEWRLPFPPPRDLPEPENQTCVSCIACIGKWILHPWATREAVFFVFINPWIRKSLSRLVMKFQQMLWADWQWFHFLPTCIRKGSPSCIHCGRGQGKDMASSDSEPLI